MFKAYKLIKILNLSSTRVTLSRPVCCIRPNPCHESIALRLFEPQRNNFLQKIIKLICYPSSKPVLAVSVLGWLGFKDEDEEKESELILTLKRAVLCSQREQYDTAEQLLHIALKIAQEQQNRQGVLYCYDLMANLAFTRLDFVKSETLFIDVMKMLLADGVAQDDLKVIHISLKLARIAHLRTEDDRASVGYIWCLEQIEKHSEEDVDSLALRGVIHDWYSQFLLDKGNVKQSLVHLKEAYKICCNIKGKSDTQSMLLLNDLGTTSWRAGDIEYAENCLNEAIIIGKTLADQSHLGVFLANLGVLYIYKGLKKLGEKYCKEAWKIGKKNENQESIDQANYCFLQLKD